METVEMKSEERRQVWRERVALFRASGQSGRAWCIENDIREHLLWYWVRRIEATCAEAETQWLPVAVEGGSPATNTGLSVRIGNAVVEVQPGFDHTLLADVIKVLTKQC